MAKFEPKGGDVAVFTDAGVYVGTARSNGAPLSSADALAQLGFELVGGDLRPLKGSQLLAIEEARERAAAEMDAYRAQLAELEGARAAAAAAQEEAASGTQTATD